jgi:hypothetical protein
MAIILIWAWLFISILCCSLSCFDKSFGLLSSPWLRWRSHCGNAQHFSAYLPHIIHTCSLTWLFSSRYHPAFFPLAHYCVNVLGWENIRVGKCWMLLGWETNSLNVPSIICISLYHTHSCSKYHNMHNIFIFICCMSMLFHVAPFVQRDGHHGPARLGFFVPLALCATALLGRVDALDLWDQREPWAVWNGMVGVSKLPIGKRLHNFGKSPCLMGTSTINSNKFRVSKFKKLRLSGK